MKSKEAIRNEIVRYVNMIWGTKNPNNINPLFQLMIEEVCNELYLLDNKLGDIDATILEKLVETLSPSGYNYVRPAHGVLQVRPAIPMYHLNRKVEFSIKELSDQLKNSKNKPPVFTSPIDITLYNISVKHLFFNRSLWSVDEYGNKSLEIDTEKKASYNTVWIGLEANPEIKQPENLFFYIDFPHLNDNHDYYDLLSATEWSMAGKRLNVRAGLPVAPDSVCTGTERDILHFYETHYRTITDAIRLDDISVKTFPSELSAIIPEDIPASLPEENWLSISFPPQFEEADIDKMIIVLNAFPVLNGRYNEYLSVGKNISDTLSLPSETGEEFLEIESVSDTNSGIFTDYDTAKKRNGTYTVVPIRKKKMDDGRICDYLERFIDVIQNDKPAFPEIDEEKIQEVLNLLLDIQDQDSYRLDLNRMNEYADVATLSVRTDDNTATPVVSYRTTLAGQINGLEEGTVMMATKVSELNRNKAVFLTPVVGGRTFYDMESLEAINRFFLTSKGRILTKYDIIGYCRLEVGKYAESINVAKSVKISHRFKTGLINVMEIQIKPKEKYRDYLNEKEVIKDLRTRLVKRSPNNYDYVVNIIK
ncbi:MAG: hypothetical protein FWF54_01510 [Candidatus Azobacteroides sp.]|nr:hypothetical protein [Candidatus Azobacteroides sp.]